MLFGGALLLSSPWHDIAQPVRGSLLGGSPSLGLRRSSRQPARTNASAATPTRMRSSYTQPCRCGCAIEVQRTLGSERARLLSVSAAASASSAAVPGSLLVAAD